MCDGVVSIKKLEDTSKQGKIVPKCDFKKKMIVMMQYNQWNNVTSN